jgi:hypothetical protein
MTPDAGLLYYVNSNGRNRDYSGNWQDRDVLELVNPQSHLFGDRRRIIIIIFIFI